jgi:site-specific DNA-cytosine methylase
LIYRKLKYLVLLKEMKVLSYLMELVAQGLPDNYTEGVSTTQRYKCLGNAFNVDVICHILGEIK